MKKYLFLSAVLFGTAVASQAGGIDLHFGIPLTPLPRIVVESPVAHVFVPAPRIVVPVPRAAPFEIAPSLIFE